MNVMIDALRDGAWRESRYTGKAVPFAPILPADDLLHPVAWGGSFEAIETNLYGFNVPEADIQCNLYALWHHGLGTMSIYILVYKGAGIFPHQLSADYFNEHLYLPPVGDIGDWSARMGSCDVRIKMVRPLEEILIQFKDAKHDFALDLKCSAALPPVGRPGGKHFTQLMRTSGEVVIGGQQHAIDGHYMRDRSWSYDRPEQPELVPPYRWMTGWFGDDCAFVIAWFDTGMLDGAEFGPEWSHVIGGPDGAGVNKWESGGPTPSLNLRSGWFAVNGRPIPVVGMRVRTLVSETSRLLVKRIEMEIEDAEGGLHRVTGETRSMIPKLYWGNLVTYMHFVTLEMDGRSGHGDLMDSYSGHHIRRFGV